MWGREAAELTGMGLSPCSFTPWQLLAQARQAQSTAMGNGMAKGAFHHHRPSATGATVSGIAEFRAEGLGGSRRAASPCSPASSRLSCLSIPPNLQCFQRGCFEQAISFPKLTTGKDINCRAGQEGSAQPRVEAPRSSGGS